MKVLVVYPSGKNEEFILDKKLITIGRSKQCDVRIDDETLSRFHCEVVFENGQFSVKDLGSANGIYYDGQKINSNVAVSFNSFIPLNLSRNEVYITETVSTHIAPEVVNPAGPNTFKSVPRKEFLKKNKKEDSSKNKLGLLFVLILLGIAAFYFSQNSNENVAGDLIDIDTSKNETNITLNEFLPASQYGQLKSTLSCDELEVCLELDLSKSLGEGVVKEGKDYLIYKYFPDTSVDMTKRKKAFLQKVSKSELFKRVIKKEIGQLHLVLSDVKNKKEEVVRIDGNYYSGDEGESDILDYEIRNFTESGVWENLNNKAVRGFFLKTI